MSTCSSSLLCLFLVASYLSRQIHPLFSNEVVANSKTGLCCLQCHQKNFLSEGFSSNPVMLIPSPISVFILINFCSEQPAILISEHSTVITDGMAPKQTEELFVKQAEVYKRARPRCPEELYAFVASLTPSHELAWDVGTGNGQAAAVISKHFQKVIATDVAEEQLKYAEQRPNITYAVTPATLSKDELTRIVGPEGSVDLVLIVEALHWFDFDKFYSNVKHVLRKPGGVIAATVYPSRPKIEAAVDKVTDEFYATIERYWAPRMLEYVDTGYRTIPFPFAPVVEENGRPQFEVTTDANLDEFLAYLESWSAVQTAIDQGEEPLGAHQRKLFADAWGPAETVRCLKWPLNLLLGTV